MTQAQLTGIDTRSILASVKCALKKAMASGYCITGSRTNFNTGLIEVFGYTIALNDEIRCIVKQRMLNRLRAAHPWHRGGRYKWDAVFSYSVQELCEHLEAQFSDGISWANIRDWHIDHIRPLASFNAHDLICEDFKAAWALSNLQPLWALDNCSKGARW
jgi:hypothetical protein